MLPIDIILQSEKFITFQIILTSERLHKQNTFGMYIICCVLWKGYNAEKASYPPIYNIYGIVNATGIVIMPRGNQHITWLAV